MKSTTATSLAALAAVVYGSSVFGAPIDAPPPAPVTGVVSGPAIDANTSAISPDDLAIRAGIRHGIKEGIQNALSEALNIPLDHNLVREQEVDQVQDCIGPKVTDAIIVCIKKENLSIHAPGDQASQEQHTESIQKCIDPSALEHVSYCVGKLEIQRLGEDARILQQMYDSEHLKQEEKLYENPSYESNKDQMTELDQDTTPLFDQNWYDSHKATFGDHDLTGSKAIDLTTTPPPPAPAPLPADVKPTNSTTTPSPNNNDGSKKDDPTKPIDPSTTVGKDAPFVKRKFGYGPNWKTAPGVRDPHPLARRSDLMGESDQNDLGALIVVQGSNGNNRGNIDWEADEDKERLGPHVLHLKAHRLQSDMLKRDDSESQV